MTSVVGGGGEGGRQGGEGGWGGAGEEEEGEADTAQEYVSPPVTLRHRVTVLLCCCVVALQHYSPSLSSSRKLILKHPHVIKVDSNMIRVKEYDDTIW